MAWYEYHPTHAAYNAKAFLEGYSGYLQTDGYDAYDSAVKDMPGIIHVGCLAHVRRHFFEAEKIGGQGKTAGEALEYIRKLYDIERELRKEKDKLKQTDDKFLIERKEQAEPVLNDFKSWLLDHVEKVPPSLLLGKAISYSLGQWDKLVRYLESPYLTPDNNACENAIRPFVMGRRYVLNISMCSNMLIKTETKMSKFRSSLLRRKRSVKDRIFTRFTLYAPVVVLREPRAS